MSVSVESRTDRLVELLEGRELDSLLVSNLINVRYLTGFTGTNGAVIVRRDGERLFFTDFRYVEQAADQVRGFDTVTVGGDMTGDVASRLVGRTGFDDEHMTVRAHAKLGDKLDGGVELVGAGGIVEDLRLVKDADEVAAMRGATQIADEVYEHLRDRGLAGRIEREVALEIEFEMRRRGAEGPSFPPIVASGAHGALPHGVPRDVEIPADTLVVLDFGAILDGYCSDCTRTFATGSVDEQAQEAYGLVLRAQVESLAAVRAGANCREVDAVARTIIEEAGHGDHFGHGLGHGVGLEIHEGPRLAKTAEGDLRAGSAVTVEPGVYLPGVVGVRIEDLAIVTADGSDVLTTFPKELTVAS